MWGNKRCFSVLSPVRGIYGTDWNGGRSKPAEQKPTKQPRTYRSPWGDCGIFCSTGFCLFPSRFLISGKNHQFRAPALPWVRFSFVEKWNCLRCLRPYQCDKSLLPHCRGPPIGLDFSKKFRMIGGTQRGCWQKKVMDQRAVHWGIRGSLRRLYAGRPENAIFWEWPENRTDRFGQARPCGKSDPQPGGFAGQACGRSGGTNWKKFWNNVCKPLT